MQNLIKLLNIFFLLFPSIAIAALSPQITVYPSTTVQVGQLVYFDGDASTYEDEAALELGRYEWDFGDGYTHKFDYPSLTPAISARSGLSVAHYFMAPGVYTVTMNVKCWANNKFQSSGYPKTFLSSSTSSAQIGLGSKTFTVGTGLDLSTTQPAKFVYKTTSTSSTEISMATGIKTFTIDTGETLFAGAYTTVSYSSDPDIYMYGTVTSYNSETGELVMNVTRINGSGTYSSWNVSCLNTSRYMVGTVTSYNSGTGELVIDSIKYGGLGYTYAEWQSEFELLPDAEDNDTVEITVTGTTPVSGFEVYHAPFEHRSKQYLYIQIPSAYQNNSYKLKLTLIDSLSNETVLIAAHDNLSAEEIYLFDQTSLSADDYQLKFQILDSGDSQITGGIWNEFFTKGENNTPTIAIDENNSFRLNGELYFPIAPFMVDMIKTWPEPDVTDFSPEGNNGSQTANLMHTTGYVATYDSESWGDYLDFIATYGFKAFGPNRGDYFVPTRYWGEIKSTSSSSVSIGSGAKTFTVETGKTFTADTYVTVSVDGDSTSYMSGTVTAYNSETGELIINVTETGGSGTYNDWAISNVIIAQICRWHFNHNPTRMATYINDNKDHSAMFSWTWKDEPNLGGAGQQTYTPTLAAWWYLSNKYDHNHLSYANFYGMSWTKKYGTVPLNWDYAKSAEQMGGKRWIADVIGFDIYPIYSRDHAGLNFSDQGPYAVYYDSVDRIIQHNANLVPFIPAINPSNRDADAPDYKIHSEAQVYNEAWMNIIHGAKGIIWFCKFDNSSIRWNAMSNFYSRINSLKNIVLSGVPAITVSDNSDVALNRVDTLIRQVDGTTLVVAARMTEPDPTVECLYTGEEPTSITTTFTLSDTDINGDIEVVDESRTVTATAGVFQDSFAKDAVHIYRYPAQAQVQATTQASVRASGPPVSIKASGTPMRIRGN